MLLYAITYLFVRFSTYMYIVIYFKILIANYFTSNISLENTVLVKLITIITVIVCPLHIYYLLTLESILGV